jgi:hypothetical protein
MSAIAGAAPSFSDHVNLRDITNFLSDMTGKTTAYINTEMYIAGSGQNPISSVPTASVFKLMCSINGTQPKTNSLLSYFARSFNPNANVAEYIYLLRNRIPSPPPPTPRLNINNYEVMVCRSRMKFFSNDNEAYEILVKENPNEYDLTRLGTKKPTWAILFPIKAYLFDHPDLAKKYRGFMPFGKPVIKFFNALLERDVVPVEYSASPSAEETAEE